MNKYAFIIDIEKCENCNNCFLACKDEHCGNEWPGYSRPQPSHGHHWITILQKERGQFPFIDVAYLTRPCMHCDNAPCVAAAEGVIYKRDDGIVLIDPEKAKNRKDLLSVCPYGAIWWNEEEQVAQKCTCCAHLLDDGWKAPRCVQACPTGALTFFSGAESELQARIDAESLEAFPGVKEKDGRPRCYYANLYRYTRCFIGGSLAEKVNGSDECAAGIKVELRQEGMLVAEQESDDFGDFKFDKLPENSGEYELIFFKNEQETKVKKVVVICSRSIGTVNLDE